MFFYPMHMQVPPDEVVEDAATRFDACTKAEMHEIQTAFDLSNTALCANNMFSAGGDDREAVHKLVRGVAVAPGCNQIMPPEYQIALAASGGGLLFGESMLSDEEDPELGSCGCVTAIMLLPQARRV